MELTQETIDRYKTSLRKRRDLREKLSRSVDPDEIAEITGEMKRIQNNMRSARKLFPELNNTVDA